MTIINNNSFPINNNIIINPTIQELYNYAIGENYSFSSTGALLAYSGNITGRCPKDKRIVFDENTKDIDWNSNIKLSQELFNYYLNEGKKILYSKNKIFQIDCCVCWNNLIKIRLYTDNVYHALFVNNLFIKSKAHDNPDFTIWDISNSNLNEVSFPNNIITDNNLTNNLIALNFTSMNMIIYGTKYAGEIKKGIFTFIMYLEFKNGKLPLHSSCNKSLYDNSVTLFFGLSGTGKTTLSTDINRQMIGDDEHVWSDNCIYNVEGGNYAKCINLDENNEPLIWNAIKYGSLLENVVVDKNNNVDYKNNTITENTRCAYPLEYIPNSLIPAYVNTQPTNIIFLSCDAFNIIPPISKLNPEQAEFFFVLGYTSKMPGTEINITKPQMTFSPCFGGPFLVYKPKQYGEMFKNKIINNDVNVWMVNTGWIGDEYEKGGKRISITYTREIINSINENYFHNMEYDNYPLMNIQIPKYCKNIPKNILNPCNPNNIEKIKLFENKIKTIYDKI